ncbi:hypothetical protein B0F90DRAFT_1752872 [Multifurca ochricompacta]|uniref:Uncharacterized protein n=1 Tax=Multifurca ochricompacta TaxID=376703 RepID=A0AAD4QJM8_9AGAM|nr:hypothetical protein B0F90DRAFT_1752872 [Multifurca ochricompacta]
MCTWHTAHLVFGLTWPLPFFALPVWPSNSNSNSPWSMVHGPWLNLPIPILTPSYPLSVYPFVFLESGQSHFISFSNYPSPP